MRANLPSRLSWPSIAALLLALAACGSSTTPPSDDPGTPADATVTDDGDGRDTHGKNDLGGSDLGGTDTCTGPSCLPCTPACTVAGARKCTGNAVQTCGDANGDGCLDWGGDADCGDLLCSNGFCSTTCQDECTVSGSRTCDGAGFKTCGEHDGDGCLDWGTVTPCGQGTVCSNGTCGTTCKDECTVAGARQCDDGNGGVQTCGDANGDGCLEWGSALPCPDGQACSAGLCGTTCQDECPAGGARTCNDAKTGFKVCGPKASGCLGWGSDQACGDGETCSNGNCAQTCQDECTVGGARRCGGAGASYQACGDANGDGCLEWGSLVACAEGETCSGGNCQVTCVSECTVLDARKCSDSGLGWRACKDLNGDGCLEWGGDIACDAGQVCSNGNCAATCTSECTTVGARRCDGPGGFQVCGDPDGDGCLTWGTTDNCLAGETCSNGVCALACQDECTTSGAKACDDAAGGTKTCGNWDADACLEWSTPTPCPDGQTCSAGNCAVTCQDACSPANLLECEAGANGFRTCKDFNGDGCLEWGSLTPCGAAADCAGGACVAKPVPGVVRINEVFYDPVGTDTDAFVELRGPAGLDLAGFVLVGVNGADGKDYNAIALTGIVPADGLFVVSQVAAAYADLVTTKANFENGPDSVQLRWGTQVVDAVGYGDFSAHPTFFAGEGNAAPDVASGHSLARDATGTDSGDNADDFHDAAVPSPGSENTPPVVNQPPVPSFTATVLDGLQVRVDAGASSDPETAAADLKVRWDWEDDGTWDTTWDAVKTATHTFAAPGTFTIRLEVQDGAGLAASVTKAVAVTSVLNVKAEILTGTWSGLVNLTGNAWVAAGNTLTINPGTTITVTGDFTFDIKGKVLAKGDPGAPVTFVSAAGTPGSWAGISLPAGTVDHYFDYTVIEHARKGLAIAAAANVTNTTLRNNVDGMVVTECEAGLVVTRVTATENTGYGMTVAGCAGNDFQRVTATRNGLDGIKADGTTMVFSNALVADNQGNGFTANQSALDLRHCDVSGNRYGVRTGGKSLKVADSRIHDNRWEGFMFWDEQPYYTTLDSVTLTNNDIVGNGTAWRSRFADATATVGSSTANYTTETVYTDPVTAPDGGVLDICQVNYSETDYAPGNAISGSILEGATGTTVIKSFGSTAAGAWVQIPPDVSTVRGQVVDRYQASYGTISIVKMVYHAPAAVVPNPIEILSGTANCAPQAASNWWGVTDPADITARISNLGYAPNVSNPLAAPAAGAGLQP